MSCDFDAGRVDDAKRTPRMMTGLTRYNSFTGISPSQSQALVDKFHIYLTANGRISMAGLNTHNIRYFAESLDKVVRGEI